MSGVVEAAAAAIILIINMNSSSCQATSLTKCVWRWWRRRWKMTTMMSMAMMKTMTMTTTTTTTTTYMRLPFVTATITYSFCSIINAIMCLVVASTGAWQRHVGARCTMGRMVRGGGWGGAANYEINLDTKPGRHCGLKLQKPRHCVESCVLSLESLHAVRPKNLHFSAKCFCLDFLVNLIYWKISAWRQAAN